MYNDYTKLTSTSDQSMAKLRMDLATEAAAAVQASVLDDAPASKVLPAEVIQRGIVYKRKLYVVFSIFGYPS
jgi:hypothetical protein